MTTIIPDGATEITLNLIDEITSNIIKGEGGQCLAKWEALQYFLGTLSKEDRESKNDHYAIAKILASVESFDPYDLTFEDAKPSAEPDEDDDATPLVWWSEEQWQALNDAIFDVMQSVGAKESSLLQTVMDLITMHETLASIRSVVEQELTTKASGPVVIGAKDVTTFFKDVRNLENNDIRNDIENLLVGADGSRTTRSNTKSLKGMSLKPIQDLKPILQAQPFHFGHIQRKIRKLVGKWAVEFMPSLGTYLGTSQGNDKEPRRGIKRALDAVDSDEEDEEVAQVKKTPPRSSGRKKAPRVLPEQIGETGGVQILDDDDTAADDADEEQDNEYSQSPITSPDKRRKKRVNFTQEEKDAIKEGVAAIGKAQWSQVRNMYAVLSRRSSKAVKNCYKTMVKNEYIFVDNEDEDSPVKKPAAKPRAWGGRKRWTAEEYAAIRAGVRKHHVGAWAKIKEDEDFKEALRDRTGVMIKDGYRVLCNRNEG